MLGIQPVASEAAVQPRSATSFAVWHFVARFASQPHPSDLSCTISCVKTRCDRSFPIQGGRDPSSPLTHARGGRIGEVFGITQGLCVGANRLCSFSEPTVLRGEAIYFLCSRVLIYDLWLPYFGQSPLLAP